MSLHKLMANMVEVELEDLAQYRDVHYSMAWIYNNILWCESIYIDEEGAHLRYSDATDKWELEASEPFECDITYLIHQKELENA